MLTAVFERASERFMDSFVIIIIIIIRQFMRRRNMSIKSLQGRRKQVADSDVRVLEQPARF